GERDPRPRAPRGGARGHRPSAPRSARPLRRARSRARGQGAAGRGVALARPARGAPRAQRPREGEDDPEEPGRQRAQVHAPRQRRGARERGRRAARHQGERHRHRHRGGRPAGDLRDVPPGGRLPHAPLRRRGARAPHRAAAGRPPRRPDHGREHARGGLLLHRDPPARDGRGQARRERGEDRLVSGAPHPAAAGGAQAEETALRDVQRAETDRLLATRLDLTAVLFLVFVGGSVVIEATQVPARAARCGSSTGSYGLEALVCLLAVVACRVPRLPLGPCAIAAALASALAALLSAYNASLGGSVERLAMTQVCLLTGLVVLLPWGWRAQLAVAAASFASFGLALPHLFTSDSLLMSRTWPATRSNSRRPGAWT